MLKLAKRPLPRHCIPSENNGQLKTMIDVSGIVIRSFNVARVYPNNKFDTESCINLIIDLNLAGPDRGLIMQKDHHRRYYTSPHYLIDRDGMIFELIPPPVRSWHSGPSSFNGKDYCNNWMIGVWIIGDSSQDFTEHQYLSLSNLCKEFMSAYRFSISNIATHKEVSLSNGSSIDYMLTFSKPKLYQYIDVPDMMVAVR